MVIASLGPRLKLADANEVVKARPENGYTNISVFFNDRIMTGSGVDPEGLVSASDYYQLNGQAIFGRSEVTLYSSLVRDPSRVKVFSHSIGAY